MKPLPAREDEIARIMSIHRRMNERQRWAWNRLALRLMNGVDSKKAERLFRKEARS